MDFNQASQNGDLSETWFWSFFMSVCGFFCTVITFYWKQAPRKTCLIIN